MLGIVSGFAAVLVMALYINGESIARLYPHQAVVWLTVPILLYWISRMWVKAHRGEMHDDPVVFAMTDGLSQLTIAAFLGVMLVAGAALVMRPVSSWGRLSRDLHDVVDLDDGFAAPEDASPARDSPALPFGNGRSYGDVCLNAGGVAVGDARPRSLPRLRRPNRRDRCEAGRHARGGHRPCPAARLVPCRSRPGTQLVTVGGAVANDVHGKNHHRDGSFGEHVESLDAVADRRQPRSSAAPTSSRSGFAPPSAAWG